MGSGSQWGMIIGAVLGGWMVIAAAAAPAAGAILLFGVEAGSVMYGIAVGASIGGLAGGLISPTDFSGPEVQGPRLSDLQLMGVSEGAGITKCYGDQLRIAGQLIAAGNLIETKESSKNPTDSGKSFIAGTPVMLSSGQDIPIENIQVGDLLLTAHLGWWQKLRDKDPRIRRRRVTHIHQGETKRAVTVTADFDNKDLKSVKFTCTPDHEVYGYKAGRKPHWFQVQGLRIGDALYTEHGWVRVVNCDRCEMDATTYNLTVADDHNYFASGALVHNGGGGGSSGKTTWYTYKCDVVVAVCEGPIHSVKRMYLNGKVKYKLSLGYYMERATVPANSTPEDFTDFEVISYAEPIGEYNNNGHSNTAWRYLTKIIANPDTGGNDLLTPFLNWSGGMEVTCSGATDNGVTPGDAVDWNENVKSIFYVDSADRNYIVVESEGTTSRTNPSGNNWQYTHTFTNSFDNPTIVSLNNIVSYSTLFRVNNSGAKLQTTTIPFGADVAADIRTYIGDDGLQNADALVILEEGAWNSSPDTWNDGGITKHYHNEAADTALTNINTNSPAYRGTAYVAFDGLELRDFGNQMPQFNFEVDSRPREPERNDTETTLKQCTIGQVIDSLLIRAGRYKHLGIGGAYTVGDHFDTTEFQGDISPTPDLGTSNLVRGYGIVGAKAPKSSLANLILCYDILVSESSGYIKFIRRGQEDVLVVPETDLAAYTFPETGEVGKKFGTTDQPDTGMPNEINIDYLDVNNKYQKASQKARKTIVGLPRVDGLDLPMALTATEAQEVANRVLYQTWSQRNLCSFTLPPKYVNINENDILSVTVDGENYKVRVLQINRGADFLHEIKGLITESSFAPYTGEGDDGTQDPDDPYFPPYMLTYAIESPAFHSDAINEAGHYILGCTSKVDQEFRGADVYTASVTGGPYSVGSSYPAEAMVVYVILPTEKGPVDCWDDSTSIHIKVLGPLPESAPASAASDVDVFNGSNLLYIGGELIGFKTVTPVGGTTDEYELTRLIRGRRGTNDRVSTHTVAEYGFIISYENSIGIVDVPHDSNSSIGVTQYYKLLPQGGAMSDFNELQKVAEGRRVKPFPVGGIKGYNTSPYATGPSDSLPNGDWIVDFVRCDRAFFTLFSAAITPNTDGTEEYRCRVYKADGTTLLRTITHTDTTTNGTVITPTVFDEFGNVSSSPKLVYNITDYAADNNKLEASIVIELFKIGSIVEEGVFTQHTITQDFKY